MRNVVIATRREVAVLDLGTSKICCAIAKCDSKGALIETIGHDKSVRILGAGCQLSKGIKRNTITNLEELEESIINAVFAAEKDAQKSVKSIVVALPSWAIESHNIDISITLGSLPVDEVHISSLLNFDTSKYIDSSRDIIHIFPISYSIDDATDIQDPIGMIGETLSVNLHVMTISSSLLKNVKNSIVNNNIAVEGFVSSAYVSGLSILLNEEISSGVTVVDIGGTTTSIAFFRDGNLLHVETIAIGGQNITNDISVILRTTRSHAERLKILYGVSSDGGISMSSSNEEQCLVPRIDEYGEEHIQNISKSLLDSIIRARIEEIIELIEERLKKVVGSDNMLCRRIVITGGGSRLSGLHEFIKAKRYFNNASVRLGKPIGAIGSHDFVQTASFATSAGATLYCLGLFINNNGVRFSNLKRSFWQKVLTWFRRGV